MEWAADKVLDIDSEICAAGLGFHLLTCFFYRVASRSARVAVRARRARRSLGSQVYLDCTSGTVSKRNEVTVVLLRAPDVSW